MKTGKTASIRNVVTGLSNRMLIAILEDALEARIAAFKFLVTGNESLMPGRLDNARFLLNNDQRGFARSKLLNGATAGRVALFLELQDRRRR